MEVRLGAGVGVNAVNRAFRDGGDVLPAGAAEDLADRVVDVVDVGEDNVGVRADRGFFSQGDIALLVGQDVVCADDRDHLVQEGAAAEAVDVGGAGDLKQDGLAVGDGLADSGNGVNFRLRFRDKGLTFLGHADALGDEEDVVLEHLNAARRGDIGDAGAHIAERLEGIAAAGRAHAGGEDEIGGEGDHLLGVGGHHVESREVPEVIILSRIGVDRDELVLKAQVDQGLGDGGSHRDDGFDLIRDGDGVAGGVLGGKLSRGSGALFRRGIFRGRFRLRGFRNRRFCGGLRRGAALPAAGSEGQGHQSGHQAGKQFFHMNSFFLG